MQETLCGRCGTKSRLHGIEYCANCLKSIVANRAGKVLKSAVGRIQNKNFQRQQRPKVSVIIIGEHKLSLECAASIYLVKQALGHDFSVNVKVADPKKAAIAGKDAIIILPQCSDYLATGLIRRFISAPQISQPHARTLTKPINILESITEKELALYAGIRRIKYEKKNKDLLQQAVEKLQEKHPGTVESIARSAARLRKIEEDE